MQENRLLLEERGMGTPLEAVVWLAGRLRARSPRGAAEFLELGRDDYDERVALGLVITNLYEEIFPEHAARSTRPPFTTEREIEFYRLVNEHKFPIDLSLPLRHVNFVYHTIPIRGMQNHDWLVGCPCPFERLEPPFQVVIALCNTWLGRSDWWPRFVRLYGLQAETRPPAWEGVNIAAFVELCMQEPALRLLPLAFMFVSYRTGNLFLDTHRLNPTFSALQWRYQWNAENIETLAAHWRKAKKLLVHIAALSEWLKQDSQQKMARIVALWNRAATL